MKGRAAADYKTTFVHLALNERQHGHHMSSSQLAGCYCHQQDKVRDAVQHPVEYRTGPVTTTEKHELP